jgi:hypothetical protein
LEVNGAIREVIELTRGEALKNGVSVQVELADGLPLVQGDRVELQQVLLNLVVNAFEAMSGTSEGTRRLQINSRKAESGGVCVSVVDSGPGLAPGTIDRLFEAFYTTKPGGLGLGLCICRSIIEAHGGQLWASANNNMARGITFQFTVPAQPDNRLIAVQHPIDCRVAHRMDREAPVVAVSDQHIGHQPLFCPGGYPVVVGIVRIRIACESGAKCHSTVRGHLADRVKL